MKKTNFRLTIFAAPMRPFKRIVKYALYLFLFLGVCAITAHCTFKHYASTSYAAAKKQIPYDVVIVPGFPYQDTGVNAIYKARVLWAKHLYDSGYTKNVIFSGSAVYTPYVESRTMKLFAMALGMPERNLFTEERAEHSSENIYFGWKLARELGFKKIALATDPYQCGMLRGVIDKYTPGVMSLPIQFEKINVGRIAFSHIDVSSAIVNPFTPLTQREGFWERLRGTLGKRVKEDAVRAAK
jgi:uncharacterized SAM-binding protein YcdF (DUF218 family)